jgi:hypothetical protein
MKKFITRLLLIVALLVPVTVISTGCPSGLPPAQQAVAVEYKALSSVVNVVELGRTIYSDLYRQGKVSKELDDKVAIIYAEYQRIGNQAIAVARAQAAAANAGTPIFTDNIFVPQLQALVNQLLELFTKAGVPAQPPVTIAPGPGI